MTRSARVPTCNDLAPCARFRLEDWMRLLWHVSLDIADQKTLLKVAGLCAMGENALRIVLGNIALRRLRYFLELVPVRFCPDFTLGPDGTREKLALCERLAVFARRVVEQVEQLPEADRMAAQWLHWLRAQGIDPARRLLAHFAAMLEQPRRTPPAPPKKAANTPPAPNGPTPDSPAPDTPDAGAPDADAPDADAPDAADPEKRGTKPPATQRPFDPARDAEKVERRLCRQMIEFYMAHHLDEPERLLLKVRTISDLTFPHARAVRRARARRLEDESLTPGGPTFGRQPPHSETTRLGPREPRPPD